MKHLLLFVFVLAMFICNGQAKIEMSPFISISPNDTATYNSSVSLNVFVKNTGNLSYSGIITIYAKRDTVAGVFCDSTSLTTLMPFQPGDSLQASLTFSPTAGPNAFKVAGNGNTIVVWPISNSLIGDSLRTILWISDANGIKEFESDQFKLFPNPVFDTLTIKPFINAEYKKIIIYDVFARKVKEMQYSENIDLSELKSGTYWMIINSLNKSYRVPFIKE